MLACVRGSKPAKGQKTYPYLLGGCRWTSSGAPTSPTCPCAGAFFTRKVQAWRISNTLEADFYVEALNEAIRKFIPISSLHRASDVSSFEVKRGTSPSRQHLGHSLPQKHRSTDASAP